MAVVFRYQGLQTVEQGGSAGIVAPSELRIYAGSASETFRYSYIDGYTEIAANEGGLVLDGRPAGDVVFEILRLSWDGNTTDALVVSADDEGHIGHFFVLAGDPLPVPDSMAELQAFLDGVQIGPVPAGSPVGPGKDIPFQNLASFDGFASYDFETAMDVLGLSDTNTVAEHILEGMLGGAAVSDVTYTGAAGAAFLINQFDILPVDPDSGLPHYEYSGGFMLSSGDFPAPYNSALDSSKGWWTSGDDDLTASAQQAFTYSGETYDAAIIEFTITVTDPEIDALRMELVFGSEEYPEYANSSYVDIAAVYVNGVNHALFDNNPLTPLSVIDQNIQAKADGSRNFINNNDGNGVNEHPGGWYGPNAPYGVEWDGFSRLLSIRAPLELGDNTIKIGVADTHDHIYDSAFYVQNLELSGGGGTGGGVYNTVHPDTQGNVAPTNLTEEIVLAPGQTNTILGTLQSLDGDLIVNFSDDDALIFEGSSFTAQNITFSEGSVIMEIDADGDGTTDSTVTFAGDHDPAGFAVGQEGGDTVITYETPEEVAGTVQSRGGEAITGAEVTLDAGGSQQVTTTDASGGFSFEAATGTIALDAALAHDGPAGTISASDALMALRLAVGLSPAAGQEATAAHFIAADADGDGQVNANDALQILRHAVGLDSDLEAGFVFIDADADHTGMNRADVEYDTGYAGPASGDISLLAVLVGDVDNSYAYA